METIRDIDVEDLITAVWLRPILWDQRNEKCHNRILVEKSWKEVETTLKTPRDDAKKKWENLRDQFRSELKKIPVSKYGYCGLSEDQYESYTTWTYFKPLLFLKDQMSPRKYLKSLDIFSGLSTARSALEDPSSEISLDDDISGEIRKVCDSNEIFYEPKNKKAKPNATTELLDIDQQKLLSLEREEKDSDESFFDSLLPYMRKMEMNEKLLCRMEIQKVIYHFSIKEKQSN